MSILNPVVAVQRLFGLLFGRKPGAEGESEIERQIREALRQRARQHKAALDAARAHGAAAGAAQGEGAPSAGGAEAPPSPLHRAGSVPKHIVSLNTIALRFPKVDSAFKQIREKFDHYDKDKNQSIDMEELKECLAELQVSVSEEEMRQLFQEADMDCSNGVQVKEFILLMAIVHLLRPSQEEGGARFGLPEVEAAFNMVEDAFIFFDENEDGYLSKAEISHALRSGKEGMAGAAAAERFAEMDYNTDGQCSFKEFLYAYAGWVESTEEDEEEKMESGGPSCPTCVDEGMASKNSPAH